MGCGRCGGTGSYYMEGDLHKSGGMVPCDCGSRGAQRLDPNRRVHRPELSPGVILKTAQADTESCHWLETLLVRARHQHRTTRPDAVALAHIRKGEEVLRLIEALEESDDPQAAAEKLVASLVRTRGI